MIVKFWTMIAFSFVILGWHGSCVAVNNLFLPGDAFFPTELTKKDIEALLASRPGEYRFSYSAFGGYDGAFCGYAGYECALIPSVDEAFAKHLSTVYSKIREYEGRKLYEEISDGKIELTETNPIRVLFYSSTFKFREFELGLRYNEHWVEEVVKFGHSRRGIRECGLISHPDAVEACWRDADVVSGIKVKLPQVPLKPVPATTDPVVFDEPAQAIVIGSQSLQEFFRPTKEWKKPYAYVVDSQGIKEWVVESGKWKPVERTSSKPVND